MVKGLLQLVVRQFYTVGGVAQRDVALVDVVGAGPFGLKEQAEDVDGSAVLVQAGAADAPDLRRKGAGMRVRRVRHHFVEVFVDLAADFAGAGVRDATT